MVTSRPAVRVTDPTPVAIGARPFEGRISRALSLLICIAAVCWLATGFLLGVQPDEEEYRHTIPSTVVAAQAMQRGELAFWTSELGLGVPQPFGQSLTTHPLTPLLGLIPVVEWVQLFYATHLIVAALGIWLVTRRVGARRWLRRWGSRLMFCVSPQNYPLKDFWPSTWPGYPWAPLTLLGILGFNETGNNPVQKAGGGPD